MSTLQIEERITVHAPPKRVWKFLLDPARVAACLPGAKLDGTEGEDTFLGTMKIKVGPVVMEIKGKATMSHIDPVERRVTLSGTGNDKAGGGSARMDMKSQILEVEGGGSEILVHADVHLAGKLVRFGRGMMEGISKQLFKQFAERVHAALDEDDDDEEEEHVEEAAAAPAEPAPAPEAKAPAVEAKAPAPEAKAPAPEATAEPAAVEKAPPTAPEGEPATAEKAPPAEAPAVKEASMPGAAAEKAPPAEPAAVEKAPPAEPEGEPAAVEKASPAEPTAAEKAPPAEPAAAAEAGPAKAEKAPAALAPVRKKKATKKPVVAPADNAPLDAGGLVWAAIWAWIKGLFARIFSR